MCDCVLNLIQSAQVIGDGQIKYRYGSNNAVISVELEPDMIDVSRDYLYCTDPDLDDRITGCDDDYTH